MRAFEFIRTDVGIPSLPVKLSGFIPGFLSDGNGPTHQALEDISLMRGIPNMEVYAPADEDDLVKMLPYIWSTSRPAYVRINTRATDYIHSDYEPGKAEIVASGNDITFLTYGLMFEQCLQAMKLLTQEGKSVGLINFRSLKPFDESALLQAVAGSKLLITVEDHFLTGGLYTIVAETLLKHKTTADVMPFALAERWFKPALLPDVLKHEGFMGKQIAEEVIGYKIRTEETVMQAPAFAE
jgi:transketolase